MDATTAWKQWEAWISVGHMELVTHAGPNLTLHMDTTTAWKHWEAWISAGHGTRRACHLLCSSTVQPNLSPNTDVTNQLAQMVACCLLNLKDMGSSPTKPRLFHLPLAVAYLL